MVGGGANAPAQVGTAALPFSANGRPLAAALRPAPPPGTKRQKLNPADAPNPVVFVATKDTRYGQVWGVPKGVWGVLKEFGAVLKGFGGGGPKGVWGVSKGSGGVLKALGECRKGWGAS